MNVFNKTFSKIMCTTLLCLISGQAYGTKQPGQLPASVLTPEENQEAVKQFISLCKQHTQKAVDNTTAIINFVLTLSEQQQNDYIVWYVSQLSQVQVTDLTNFSPLNIAQGASSITVPSFIQEFQQTNLILKNQMATLENKIINLPAFNLTAATLTPEIKADQEEMAGLSQTIALLVQEKAPDFYAKMEQAMEQAKHNQP